MYPNQISIQPTTCSSRQSR